MQTEKASERQPIEAGGKIDNDFSIEREGCAFNVVAMEKVVPKVVDLFAYPRGERLLLRGLAPNGVRRRR